MARLNNRPSSLARSRLRSATPNSQSDLENQAPDETDPGDKGKTRAGVSKSSGPSLPTPTSEEGEDNRGHKRRRLQDPSAHAHETASDMDEDEARFNRYFDPNQDLDKRRRVKRKARALVREFNESRDDILRGDGNGLKDTINRANNVFKSIKQTNDATVDSRLFVDVSNLALKRSNHLVQGDRAAGIDVEEFLTKALHYMRNGGPLSSEQHLAISTQTQRRRNRYDEDDDDNDDTSEPIDWEVFGEIACFPYNSRPACPSFLLGPLSVEKKQRKQTQRSARQSKDTNTREARPEALSRADLNQSDENTLTSMCTRIREHLIHHCTTQLQAMRERFRGRANEIDTREGKTWLKEHRITRHRGPHLFDYAVNPHSFGQTVENLFYISFLIKEGAAAITKDDDGLPVINPSQATDVEQKRAMKSTRHQAVFSLDYQTWRKLVKAFDITEPMIPHRNEEQPSQLTQAGWYA